MNNQHGLQGIVRLPASQPERLAAKGIEASMPANVPFLATITNSRAERHNRPDTAMVFFCPTEKVILHQMLTGPTAEQNGLVVPAHMVNAHTPLHLHDYRLPDEGYWTIHQVLLMAVVAGGRRGLHVGMLPQTQVVENSAPLNEDTFYHFMGAFNQ